MARGGRDYRKPPYQYQSKNKMQQELGTAYLQKLRNAYPDIPGRADYCVYWFQKAHDALKSRQRAGLVGTNTIRQNYSPATAAIRFALAFVRFSLINALATDFWSANAIPLS
jgi:hypothetical protein